jgi:hypothetical protein
MLQPYVLAQISAVKKMRLKSKVSHMDLSTKKRLQPYVWTQMNPYNFSFESPYCMIDRASP